MMGSRNLPNPGLMAWRVSILGELSTELVNQETHRVKFIHSLNKYQIAFKRLAQSCPYNISSKTKDVKMGEVGLDNFVSKEWSCESFLAYIQILPSFKIQYRSHLLHMRTGDITWVWTLLVLFISSWLNSLEASFLLLQNSSTSLIQFLRELHEIIHLRALSTVPGTW